MNNPRKTQLIATGIGFIAILLWSSLALFTAISDGIPVFQLMTLTFAIGATSNMIGITLKGEFSKEMFISPPKAWLLSVGGIYLYHFFYFEGIFNAPPEQSSLINYLWPLFIVLFSALLPKGKLHWYTILGAVVAFLGVVALLLLKEGGNFQLETKYLVGYLFAFGAAVGAFIRWQIVFLLISHHRLWLGIAIGWHCLACSPTLPQGKSGYRPVIANGSALFVWGLLLWACRFWCGILAQNEAIFSYWGFCPTLLLYYRRYYGFWHKTRRYSAIGDFILFCSFIIDGIINSFYSC